MSQDTYVEVMVELTRLRRLPPSARGAPERERLSDSIRADILSRHGVTAEQVVAFADFVGRDPTLMMGLSQAISERSDSITAALARADSGQDAGIETTEDMVDEEDGLNEQAIADDEAIADEEAAATLTDSVPGPRFGRSGDAAAPAESSGARQPSAEQLIERLPRRPARKAQPD
jgi:hypothetical protein